MEEECTPTDSRPRIASLVLNVLAQLSDASPGQRTHLMSEQDPNLIKEAHALLGEQMKLITEPKLIFDYETQSSRFSYCRKGDAKKERIEECFKLASLMMHYCKMPAQFDLEPSDLPKVRDFVAKKQKKADRRTARDAKTQTSAEVKRPGNDA